MYGGEKPLDNPINWSFRVGRLFGIDIRVHVAFVICAVVLIWMEIPDDDSVRHWLRIFVDALGMYAILFVIVLLHEFGHCFGARHTGGEADEILLWPLGGLASVRPPHQAGAHMITTIAGPMVNVILCAICTPLLVVWMKSLGAVPWNPIHPFQPVDPTLLTTEGQRWLLRVYGISYFLLLVNLLPVFPFDGGRILQAWLWPRKGYRASMELATGTGMIGAILIGLIGLFLPDGWLLMMIAVFGYMTCWQTQRMLREHGGYDIEGVGAEFSQGYTHFDPDMAERKPGFFERRRLRKAIQKAERTQRQEAAHEKAVEDILRKVSQAGVDSLTPQERRILEQETRRKRTLKP